MKSMFIAAVIALSPLAIGAAQAGDYKINIDRTLLQSQEGLTEFHRDLKREARDICKSEGFDPRELARFTACTNDVVDIAVGEVADERLTAFHQGEEPAIRLTRN